MSAHGFVQRRQSVFVPEIQMSAALDQDLDAVHGKAGLHRHAQRGFCRGGGGREVKVSVLKADLLVLLLSRRTHLHCLGRGSSGPGLCPGLWPVSRRLRSECSPGTSSGWPGRCRRRGGALGFRRCAAVSGGSGTGTLVLSLERAFSSRLVCLYTRVLYLNWKSGMEARYPVCMHESFGESCH